MSMLKRNTPSRSLAKRLLGQLFDLSGAALAVALMMPHAAFAAAATTETVEVEYIVDDGDASFDEAGYVDAPAVQPRPGVGASYGPFSVTGDRITMNGAVYPNTPAKFRALLAAHPGVKTVEMVDCPGSEDDDANLALARMIRAAGLNTHVPSDGSIRSGAVELFLAGKERTSAPGAQFGVHSWRDDTGREARDYAADAAVHAPYLRFYREVGFTPDMAKAFYDFTNRASFDDIHYMTGAELARYGVTTGPKQIAIARLDY
jgi:ATP-dependent protease ClpP protease subunit